MTIQIPATWKFGLIAVGVAVAASIAINAVPAYATDVPPCLEGDIAVTETGTGTGVFTAAIVSHTVTECGAWLQTFTFDNSYVPVDASDYGHPQTAIESEWVVLSSTTQTFNAVIPACGPYQTDFSVGPLQTTLPQGDLGADWVAGSVGVRPLCVVIVYPLPTATPASDPSPSPSSLTFDVDAAVASAPSPPLLAPTGGELWLLIPAGFLGLIGVSLLVAARRAHQ